MRLLTRFPDRGATAPEIVSGLFRFRNAMPTFASSLKSDGDDRRPVEECQRGLRKPNEDAASVPSGRSGRLREINDEY